MSSSDFSISIVIVDDLQFSRIVVKTALNKAGYNGVRIADSSAQALTMVEQQPADVLLADWSMPGMDGLELTQHIRQRDEEKGIYTAIILFTAHEGMDYLVQAFDQGVDDYLSKPPNPQELAARVHSAARVAALQNDLLETSRQLQTTIKKLEKMALLDELTGAGNQQFLLRNLTSYLQEASTRQGGVCLAVVELRELKDLANSHGEQIANEILISQHRRLQRAVRPTDVIAKMNDNLFGIIMHHSKIEAYKTSAIDRIISVINDRPYKTSTGNLKLKACIGVQYYRGDEPAISADEMVLNAGTKLDQARNDESVDIVY